MQKRSLKKFKFRVIFYKNYYTITFRKYSEKLLSFLLLLSDIPDRELICVGYWMENMKSYMLTYDLLDPVSNFRCWVRHP